MRAGGGTSCSNGDSASILFEFACNSKLEGEPTLVSISDECDYTFAWLTKHACMYNYSYGLNTFIIYGQKSSFLHNARFSDI